MQSITIAGNIGKSAETKDTTSGSVTSFSVAVNGRGDNTTWYRCSLWGARGEKLAQYLTKGGKVTVSGSLEATVYDGKPDLKINVSDVTLQGGKPNDGGAAHEPRRATGSAFAAQDLDDEVPF
jgi:single-strand DNA-binding protein